MRKSPRRATPPRVLPATKIMRMAHRTILHVSSHTDADKETQAEEDVKIPFVECPYCDGENVLSRNGSVYPIGAHHHEIACRYCQCLVLLSESKLGVQYRSQQQPDAA
jgi:hypothetical protein